MFRLLVAVPLMDAPTSVSFRAGYEFAQESADKGHQVKLLAGPAANGNTFTSTAKKFKPHLIAYFGHGVPEALCGIWMEMLGSRQVPLVKGTVVYAMACLAGQKLGPQVKEAGGHGFMNDDYMYCGFREIEHDYEKDFRDAWKITPRALLEGKSLTEAFGLNHDHWEKIIDLYHGRFDEWPSADWYDDAAMENMNHNGLFSDQPTLSLYDLVT